jgi:nucleotide-binding universal stress UspA family protein
LPVTIPKTVVNSVYKKILVAVNEHINSEVTGRCALHLSKSCRAKFYTCFIAEKGASEESLNRAQEAMKRLSVEAEKLGVPVESLTRTGEAVKEIEAVVRHEGIDLVFAATRREDLGRRSRPGTVARRLSLKVPCSVALIPEGLLPTVTLSLAMASQRMVKRKALIKNLSSVETLGCVTVVCTDKTGTLTQNKMTASTIWQDEQFIKAEAYKTQAHDMLMRTALLCNNARFADNEYQGDPT